MVTRQSPRDLKAVYFALTAAGTVASSYYFNYLFFLLRDRYQFDDRANLWVSALHGAIYIVAAVQCGKFAERRGPHTSLIVGFAGLTVTLLLSAFVSSAVAVVALVAVYSVVLLFIWPAMEALVISDEPPSRVPHLVGVYNCVWSGFNAIAYFSGGPLYDRLGAGAVFGVPAAIFAVSLAVAFWCRTLVGPGIPAETPVIQQPMAHDPSADHQRVPPETFRTLAWLANPLSYVAIYTLLAVMPGLAARFNLSPTQVGLFCSIWFFGRLGAFVCLWQWTGWHYRFRWLAAGYVSLVVSFAAILLAPSLWIVIVAQVLFGISTGLIYYSSLFYSMDLAEAKAEHGGLHESLIGAGIFAGPAVGAAALHLMPGRAGADAVAVTGVLVLGGGILTAIWRRALPKDLTTNR